MKVGGLREVGYDNYPVYINERAYEKIKNKFNEIVDDFSDKVYEALCHSIKSEVKHFPYECTITNRIRACELIKRKSGYNKEDIFRAQRNPVKYPLATWAIFYFGPWGEGFGGKRWAKAVAEMKKYMSLKSRFQKVYWCDRVLHMQHNTGHLLNKTPFKQLTVVTVRKKSGRDQLVLNFRAKAKSILEFVPYVSSDVKKLVIPQSRLLTAK